MGGLHGKQGFPKEKRSVQGSFVGRLPKDLGLNKHALDYSTLGQLLQLGAFFKGIDSGKGPLIMVIVFFQERLGMSDSLQFPLNMKNIDPASFSPLLLK